MQCSVVNYNVALVSWHLSYSSHSFTHGVVKFICTARGKGLFVRPSQVTSGTRLNTSKFNDDQNIVWCCSNPSILINFSTPPIVIDLQEVEVMQSRDITEILKVFEKRITKLEKKVGELEATADELKDANKDKQAGSIEKIEEDFGNFKTLDSRFDELSVERRVRPKKVTYDKSALLCIKPAPSVDSELTEHTDIERSLSIDMLEEGEVYEPLHAPLALGSKDQRDIKADYSRRRQSREKKSQSPRQSTSNKSNGRERAKSEPLLETLRSMKREVDAAAPPICKSEVHYGLLVQYPPEDDA